MEALCAGAAQKAEGPRIEELLKATDDVIESWSQEDLDTAAAKDKAKGVRVLNVRVLRGLFTVMNEFNEVVLQRPITSDAVAELPDMEPDLALLARRYALHQFPAVRVWYTDMCCTDCEVVQKVFGAAGPAVLDVEAPLPSQEMSMPEQQCQEQRIGTASTFVLRACAAIEKSAFGVHNRRCCQGRAVVGISADWSMLDVGNPTLKRLCISTVEGVAFHFDVSSTTDTLPRALEQLLANPELLKVGMELEQDVKHLLEGYGAVVAPSEDAAGVVCRYLGAVAAGDCSLDCLCAHVLQRRRLPAKACHSIQAYAVALIFAHALVAADPIFLSVPERSTIVDSTLLRLYDATNSVCVATATVSTYAGGAHQWTLQLGLPCARGRQKWWSRDWW
eukprot:TRINITY_DN201_c0_g1_i3.p2 TRINITY_DN201_c0_g1~~TRINITY_DN201_c0_g1_i3.p2  ORF type:complete len:391 (-),score=69.94 TRINITY_DN201_c0_g1_i3:2031-3203(-)